MTSSVGYGETGTGAEIAHMAISVEDEQWLIPFRGRNTSGPFNQNFLWRHKTLYVMDNHRAAAWCWLQHINPEGPHSLLHIDQHSDTLRSQLDTWRAACPADLRSLSIQEYLTLDYLPSIPDGGRLKLFSWDNYLSIYLDRYGEQIKTLLMLTHKDGDKPEQKFMSGEMWDIPANIDFWVDPKNGPWILNVDIDYFFWHDFEIPGVMVSDSYLEKCFAPIRPKIESGLIAVTTIALTPDAGITGGWGVVEPLAQKILGILGVEFALPA